MIAFDVGSKCALLLPQKIVAGHKTPAKGLIIKSEPPSKATLLVEEVWTFKGPEQSAAEEKFLANGSLRTINWDWVEAPQILKDKDYVIFKTNYTKLFSITEDILDALIKMAVMDLKVF